MPRYNDRPTRQSRFSEDEEPRSTRRQPNNSSRGRQQQQQQKTTYYPLLALFVNEHKDGRLQIDFRAFEDNEGKNIEDTLSLEEWLYFCEQVFYGEAKITGSAWVCNERYATHSGNVRLSEEQLDELRAAVDSKTGFKKALEKEVSSKRKPRYEVPAEEETEEEDEYEEVKPPSRKRPQVEDVPERKKTPVRPALDMPTEAVEEPPLPF